MKVLLINGSPHVDGVIALALKELNDTLNRCDIETEIIHVGNKNIRGCIACRSCKKRVNVFLMTVLMRLLLN